MKLLQQIALPLQPILQALVRVLDDHVQRARRARLADAARRDARDVVAIARLDPVGDPLGAAQARRRRIPQRSPLDRARAAAVAQQRRAARGDRRRGRPARRCRRRSRRWPSSRSRSGAASPAPAGRPAPGSRPAAARRARRSGDGCAPRAPGARTAAAARSGSSRPRSTSARRPARLPDSDAPISPLSPVSPSSSSALRAARSGCVSMRTRVPFTAATSPVDPSTVRGASPVYAG